MRRRPFTRRGAAPARRARAFRSSSSSSSGSGSNTRASPTSAATSAASMVLRPDTSNQFWQAVSMTTGNMAPFHTGIAMLMNDIVGTQGHVSL